MARLEPWFAALAAGFVIAAALPLACAEQDYPARAFRCDPSEPDSCPGAYLCCSTDPTALDTNDPGATTVPDYGGGAGTPVFSGINNDLGRHGRCIDPASIGALETFDATTGPEVIGCPRPCNPTWDSELVTSVCGADAVCCQTEEIGERDCVLDPSLGTSGCYRPTAGTDIAGLGGIGTSDWSRDDHDTHQDPAGDGCSAFVSDLSGDMELLYACFRKLNVAEQRGLCTAANGATDVADVCPLAGPEYKDACELLNEAQALAGC